MSISCVACKEKPGTMLFQNDVGFTNFLRGHFNRSTNDGDQLCIDCVADLSSKFVRERRNDDQVAGPSQIERQVNNGFLDLRHTLQQCLHTLFNLVFSSTVSP